MSAELKRLKDEMKAIKKELKSKGTALVRDAFVDFFQTYPEVLEVRWTQYTPSWNDGDACEFSVNEFCGVTQTDLDEVAKGNYSDEDFYHEGPSLSKAAEKALGAIQGLLDSEDFLQIMLGDDLMVKVTRGGSVETEGYEHG